MKYNQSFVFTKFAITIGLLPIERFERQKYRECIFCTPFLVQVNNFVIEFL